MNDRFESNLKRVLGAAGGQVDQQTRQALANRRRAALAAGSERPRRRRLAIWWLPAGAVAAALVAAVIVLPGRTSLPASATVDDGIDMELLLAEDNLELYEELDFYEWLGTAGADNSDAG